MNFCPNCGSDVKGMNFCINCGMKLNDIGIPEAQPLSEESAAPEESARETGPIRPEEIAVWIPTHRYERGRGKKLEFEDRIDIIRIETFHLIGKPTFDYYRYDALEGYAVYENNHKIYTSEENASVSGQFSRHRGDVIRGLDVVLYFLAPERETVRVSFIGSERERDSFSARSAYDDVDTLINMLERILKTGKVAKEDEVVRKKPTYEEALAASRRLPHKECEAAKDEVKKRYKAKEMNKKEYKAELEALERQYELDREECRFLSRLIEDDVFGIKAARKAAKEAEKKKK